MATNKQDIALEEAVKYGRKEVDELSFVQKLSLMEQLVDAQPGTTLARFWDDAARARWQALPQCRRTDDLWAELVSYSLRKKDPKCGVHTGAPADRADKRVEELEEQVRELEVENARLSLELTRMKRVCKAMRRVVLVATK